MTNARWLTCIAVALIAAGRCPCPTLAAAARAADAQQASADEASSSRVARLEEHLAQEQKRLDQLRDELKQRVAEQEAAEQELADLNATLAATKARVDATQDDAQSPALEQELASAQKRAELAKQELRVIARRREALAAVCQAVENAIEQDRQLLASLKGEAPPPATDQQEPAPKPEAPALELPSLIPGQPAAPASSEKPPEKKPQTLGAADAQREAQEKEALAESARESLTEIAERRRQLENDIEIEQQGIKADAEQQDILSRSLAALEKDLAAKQQAGAPADELNKLQQEIVEVRANLEKFDEKIDRRKKRIAELQKQLDAEKEHQQVAAEVAEEKQRAAEAAKRWEWVVKARDKVRINGPQVLILVGTLLVLWIALRWMLSRIELLLASRARGNRLERESWAQTLVAVLKNALLIVLILGGITGTLGILGSSLGPMLGGAALVGVAAAFGAQNLIRDFFSGFMILLERQYKLHDIIRIGDMQGVVESVTLRMTVLRSFDGHVFFIPNGEIKSVTNLTHGWARVVMDVGVAYGEKVDEVIRVLMTLARELKDDVRYSPFILAEPEMFGVDALADSAVIIKLGIKVRPDQQWYIKREMWRRIKNRFDELGIEIPFPQRTLHYRAEAPRAFAPETNGRET